MDIVYDPLPPPRVRADTSAIMRGFHAHMAQVEARGSFRPTDPRPVVDEFLEDVDWLREQMLPMTMAPWSRQTRRIAQASAMFIETKLFRSARDLGWDCRWLFGVVVANGAIDPDANGLIPALMQHPGYRILGFDRDCAKLIKTTEDGKKIRPIYRPKKWVGARPFWTCMEMPYGL
jgi:hypothetical protein